MSLRSHTLLTAVYGDEIKETTTQEVISSEQVITSDDLSFPRFIDSLQIFLKDVAFCHITFLCLNRVYLSPASLMSLLNLEHIGVLFLNQCPDTSRINDWDVRNWGRGIKEKTAFQHLRVFAWTANPASYNASHEAILEAVSECPELLLVRCEQGPAPPSPAYNDFRWTDRWIRVKEKPQ